MKERFYTIGMAGHIDHGKTSLTKALTNVDTDRLKEERERQISIELGFAMLYEDDEIQISVVDVPGHERFIRQMIAGVAGIDLVILVVAADEGVMPQTKEHLDILKFLGLKKGIIAITKIDRVDKDLIELVKEDILATLKETVFEDAPFVLVDSLSNKGIEELKERIITHLKNLEMRDTKGAFRLPIDQVFTVKGQGTVVRGTIYEGTIEEGQMLKIMPKGLDVRARQIQVHHQKKQKAFAGQRAAINLSGVDKESINRGDVLVSSEQFIVTKIIDVSIRIVADLNSQIKQRMPIKLHLGTSEVMGRIVFFDRNEVNGEDGEILCQLRLEKEILTKRGDRFILRRPSPAETIGGGWVIDPRGNKYRFGGKTIEELEKKKEGSPEERLTAVLAEAKSLTLPELIKRTGLKEEIISVQLLNPNFVLYNGKKYTLKSIIRSIEEELYDRLKEFHLQNSMKMGINKAVLLQEMEERFPDSLIDFVIENGIKNGLFKRKEQFVSLTDFIPHVPQSWAKRTENLLASLKHDGMKVRILKDYFSLAGIPADLEGDLKRFLENQELIVVLDEQYAYYGEVFKEAVHKLQQQTGREFEVSEAKKVLNLSRKYMIPFLEKLDALGLTKRVENKRVWKQ